MQLSEAIRIGAMLKPQTFTQFFDESSQGTCALGAALDTIGALDLTDIFSPAQNIALNTRWPEVMATTTDRCPADRCLCGSFRDLFSAVTHLNDVHRWTREAIADWVEGIERTYAPPAHEGAAHELKPTPCAASTD